MNLEETILDRLRRLPPVKQQEVPRFADSLQEPTAKAAAFRDRSAERQWIEANRAAYADRWVAVQGDRLVAADNDPVKVYAAARAEGIASPFVVHILPEPQTLFIPGW